MKRKLYRVLIVSVLLASLAMPLFACSPTGTPQDTDENNTETESATENETEAAVPIDPATFGEADILYDCDDGSLLSTYNDKTVEDYKGVCAFYKSAGYTVYSSIDMDGNPATTYVKGDALAHVYFTKYKSELNVVTSDTAGATLPPATPAATDGEIECTITQIQDTQNFIGMGYVIQLKDGSFIVYDGSYANQANKILSCIKKLHTGEGKPIVRAWLLTHSHNDHYLAFEMIAKKKSYRNQLTVEHVIVSPLNDANFSLNQDEEFYLSTKLYDDAALFGAKVVFAHTGMNFTFCNLNMEILHAPESTYKYSNDKGNFNNTSIVSRLYDENYTALFTGDVSTRGVDFMMGAYGEGDYLKSDVCQMSHHGVEGIYIMPFYDKVAPQIMFYPASIGLFTSRDPSYSPEVHDTLFTRDYIKEILVHGYEQFTRAWGTKFDANATLSTPGYVPSEPVIGEEISVQNGTGTRTPLHVSDWLGYRISVNGEITGFSYDMPTWTTTNSACTLALYKWNTDIATTLAGDPLESKRIENLVDNATNRLNFNEPQPAGDYLFVIQDVDGTAGVYCNQGSTGGDGTLYTPGGESTDQPSLKIAFSVLPAAPFGDISDNLVVDKTTYAEGESIMVTAYGAGKNWVGIAKKGSTTPIRWWYLSPNSDGVHAPAGEAFDMTTLPANLNGDGKLTAGTYTVYLFGNNGSIADGNALTSTDITITAAEGQAPDDTSLTPSIHIGFDGNVNADEDQVTVTSRGQISYVEGNNGQAAVLGSSYVSVPNFEPAGSFTVMVWAKISNLTGDPAIFATKEWSGGSNVGFALGVTEGNLHANIGDGERRADMKPSLDGVDLSGWNHYTLAFDRDAREMRVSVNFGEFSTTAIPAELVNAPYEGTGSLVLGQDTTGHYAHGSMTCVMDEFMVFDKALTQADMTALGASFAS